MNKIPLELNEKILLLTITTNSFRINTLMLSLFKNLQLKIIKIQRLFKSFRIRRAIKSKIYCRNELDYLTTDIWSIKYSNLIYNFYNYILYNRYIFNEIKNLIRY